VTFTIFGGGLAERPFDAGPFRLCPEDWLAAANVAGGRAAASAAWRRGLLGLPEPGPRPAAA